MCIRDRLKSGLLMTNQIREFWYSCDYMYLLHYYIFTTTGLVVAPHSNQLSLFVILLLLLKHNPFKYTYSSTVFKLKIFFFIDFTFPWVFLLCIMQWCLCQQHSWDCSGRYGLKKRGLFCLGLFTWKEFYQLVGLVWIKVLFCFLILLIKMNGQWWW